MADRRAVRIEAADRTEPADRRARRPINRERMRPPTDEIVVRLERLEALVTAIAEHLGVHADRLGRRRAGARREGPVGPGEAPAETHMVARIAAVGLAGHVKLYNASRGYGFIVAPDAAGDVFFHRSDCRVDPASLEQGAEVAFDLAEMANGQVKAIHVRLRGTTPASSAATGPVTPAAVARG
jgi:cold shock CspA family protein